MSITVNVLDFLHFIREVAWVVTIGTQVVEPSESVRNKPAEISNAVKPDDYRKRTQETLNNICVIGSKREKQF